MGLLTPGKALGSPPSAHAGGAEAAELQRLEARARLPKSASANFIRVIGFVVIGLSLLVLMGAGPFGLIGAVTGAVAGGFIIAAAGLQQSVFDVRTLLLRAADERENDRMNASEVESSQDA